MARLRTVKSKRNGRPMYYALFTDPDRVPANKTVTLRTQNKTAARQKLAKLEERYALGLYDPWADAVAQGVPMARAVREFTAAMEREHARGEISENHAAGLAQTARQFLRSLPPETRSDRVSPRDVDAFVWAYDNANTRWQHYARVKRLFKFLAARGYARAATMKATKRPDAPKRKPPRYLTRDEFGRILAAAETRYAETGETGGSPDDGAWWAALFTFAVWTGLRVGEIRTLRWQDVDLGENGRVRVQASGAGGTGPFDGLADDAPAWPGFSPKWGKARTVPLLPGARRALTPAEEGGLHPWGPSHVLGDRAPHRLVFPSPHGTRGMSNGRTRSGMLGRDTIERAWNACRDASGVGDRAMTFHSTRHTFASWCLQRGVPVAMLQRVLGHRHIQSTMIYAHVGDADVAGALMGAFS